MFLDFSVSAVINSAIKVQRAMTLKNERNMGSAKIIFPSESNLHRNIAACYASFSARHSSNKFLPRISYIVDAINVNRESSEIAEVFVARSSKLS